MRDGIAAEHLCGLLEETARRLAAERDDRARICAFCSRVIYGAPIPVVRQGADRTRWYCSELCARRNDECARVAAAPDGQESAGERGCTCNPMRASYCAWCRERDAAAAPARTGEVGRDE